VRLWVWPDLGIVNPLLVRLKLMHLRLREGGMEDIHLRVFFGLGRDG